MGMFCRKHPVWGRFACGFGQESELGIYNCVLEEYNILQQRNVTAITSIITEYRKSLWQGASPYRWYSP